jgi:hypothetical protein
MVNASSGVLSKFFGDLRRYQSVQQHGFFDPEKTKYPVNTLLIDYAKPVFYSMEKVNSTDTLNLSSQFQTQQAGNEADANLITATEFISAKVDDKTRIPNFFDAATTLNEREQFAGWKTKVRACQDKVMRAMGVAPIHPETLKPEARKSTSNASKGKTTAKVALSFQDSASHNLGFDQKEIDEAIRLSKEEVKAGRKASHPSTGRLGESSTSRRVDALAGSSRGEEGIISSRERADIEQALKKSLTDC